MTTVPTEGQIEKNTWKVKQYIIADDMEEFKKKKRTKNATRITEDNKKKKEDIENGTNNTQGLGKNRIDTEAEKDKKNRLDTENDIEKAE